MSDDRWIPSVDICGICADPECDGISCVSDLDADDEADQEVIERLQLLVRAGAAFIVGCELMRSAGYEHLPTFGAHPTEASA